MGEERISCVQSFVSKKVNNSQWAVRAEVESNVSTGHERWQRGKRCPRSSALHRFELGRQKVKLTLLWVIVKQLFLMKMGRSAGN
jgi:hypothetical protein